MKRLDQSSLRARDDLFVTVIKFIESGFVKIAMAESNLQVNLCFRSFCSASFNLPIKAAGSALLSRRLSGI